MKKTTILVPLLCLTLCGCSQQTMTESTKPTEAPTTEQTTLSVTEAPTTEAIIEEYVDISDYEFYDTEEAFLASKFCERMKGDGLTIYTLGYDAERFDFYRIITVAGTCKYQLFDKELNGAVSLELQYNTYKRGKSDFRLNENSYLTEAEKDGVMYDVYVYKTPYVEFDEYGIVYLPMTGYQLGIHPDVDIADTPDTALNYIQDFDLIPLEEESQNTETAPPETAEAPVETTPPEETTPETSSEIASETTAESEV